jgi:hypothetical protein
MFLRAVTILSLTPRRPGIRLNSFKKSWALLSSLAGSPTWKEKAMWNLSNLLRSSVLLTCFGGGVSLFAAPPPQPPPNAECPQVFRAVFEIHLQEEDLKLVGMSTKCGQVPKHSVTRQQILDRRTEINQGDVLLLRYETRRLGGRGLDAGYFMAGRGAHAEILDPEDGTIKRRIDETVDRIVVRTAIPYRSDAIEIELRLLSAPVPEDLEKAVAAKTVVLRIGEEVQ